jgi:phosphoribosyl 1,2-cyclic phosphodiesterase
MRRLDRSMRLIFLGTRGNTENRSRRHRRHSALLVSSGRTRIMIDCGKDWRGKVRPLRPQAIFLTHAHPDHAGGLLEGADCPVFASRACWSGIWRYPIHDRRVIGPGNPMRFGSLTIAAFPVIHSLRAPAVGFRIADATGRIFYVPDVVAIADRSAALRGIDLYIGDGATISRPMVRRHGDRLFGHTTVRAQLGWCAAEGVPQAIFTHCGSAIVDRDARTVAGALRDLARPLHVACRLARDGLLIDIPKAARRRRPTGTRRTRAHV